MNDRPYSHKTTVTCSYPVPHSVLPLLPPILSWTELPPGPTSHGAELLLSQITITWAVPQFRMLPPGHMHMVVLIHLLNPRADAGSIRSSGLLGFRAAPRNLLVQLWALVAVSNSNSEVPHRIPGLSKSLPVPQRCWAKVCRDSGNNLVCFAWGSGNGGVRNWVIKKLNNQDGG